jgi:hypothetical protein
MTDIEYWDGELTNKMAELEQSIGSLKSLLGGDKEAVRAEERAGGREGGRAELDVWTAMSMVLVSCSRELSTWRSDGRCHAGCGAEQWRGGDAKCCSVCRRSRGATHDALARCPSTLATSHQAMTACPGAAAVMNASCRCNDY